MHTQPGGAPPVFVDRTGRRRRLTLLAGTAMALGMLTSLGLIAAGLFTDSSVSLPGWSEDPPGQQPIEAGVDGLGSAPSTGPPPSPVTSTAAPVRSVPSGTTAAPVPTGPRKSPAATDRPGQGDERRTAKPSRSPGRPG